MQRPRCGAVRAVAFPSVALRPFVHDCRERRAKPVRDVVSMIACTVEQISKGILAHRLMHVSCTRKDQRPIFAQRPQCLEDGIAGSLANVAIIVFVVALIGTIIFFVLGWKAAKKIIG